MHDLATIERFMSRVETGPGCWRWRGYPNGPGYGKFTIGRDNIYAYRFSYEAFVGPVPEGLTIDHLCGDPTCVRPSHLEPATQRENILRGSGPTAVNARRTHCKHGHPLSGDNLMLVRSGGSVRRRCRECTRAITRRWQAKQKASR